MITSVGGAEPRLLFLLGFSGTGKSFMGDFAAKQKGWLYLEIDVWGADGIDESNLRDPWDRYLNGNRQPLVSDLRSRVRAQEKRGVVLSFASGFTRTREQIDAAEPDIRIRYLAGSPKHCMAAFLQREDETGRGLPREWWIANNLCVSVSQEGQLLVAYPARPEMRPYCVQAFNSDGTRREAEALFTELLR